MATPIFQPHDKIVYMGPKSARYNSHDIPICYVVSGFSTSLGNYYVYPPQDKQRIIMLTQFDLEQNWRKAEVWEEELYFG